MIEHLPSWLEILFLFTTIATIILFYFANGKPKVLISTILIWSAIQSILAFSSFYLDTKSIPPRFGLVLLPSFIIIIYGLQPKALKWVEEKRNLNISTLLHIVRIPVEIILLFLFLNKMVPELMTFEGRNFDIFAGLTAPLISWLYFNKKLSAKALFVWNLICLFLVSFILFNGILSAELPFQQFGFDQPNRGILYFPFILLPATIVPIVIYTHITDLIILWKFIK